MPWVRSGVLSATHTRRFGSPRSREGCLRSLSPRNITGVFAKEGIGGEERRGGKGVASLLQAFRVVVFGLCSCLVRLTMPANLS